MIRALTASAFLMLSHTGGLADTLIYIMEPRDASAPGPVTLLDADSLALDLSIDPTRTGGTSAGDLLWLEQSIRLHTDLPISPATTLRYELISSARTDSPDAALGVNDHDILSQKQTAALKWAPVDSFALQGRFSSGIVSRSDESNFGTSSVQGADLLWNPNGFQRLSGSVGTEQVTDFNRSILTRNIQTISGQQKLGKAPVTATVDQSFAQPRGVTANPNAQGQSSNSGNQGETAQTGARVQWDPNAALSLGAAFIRSSSDPAAGTAASEYQASMALRTSETVKFSLGARYLSDHPEVASPEALLFSLGIAKRLADTVQAGVALRQEVSETGAPTPSVSVSASGSF